MSQIKNQKIIFFAVIILWATFAQAIDYKSNEEDQLLSRFLPWEMKAFGVRITQKDQKYSLVGIDGRVQGFIKEKFAGQRLSVDMVDGRSALSLSPCVIDKGQTCMGHINFDSKRYDLYQINPNGSAQITECNYNSDQLLTENSPQLKNCFTYSALSCEKWKSFKSQSKAYQSLKDLKKKVEQCQDLLNNVQSLKVESAQIFRTTDSVNGELAREFEVTRERSQPDSKQSRRAQVTSLSLATVASLDEIFEIQKFDRACDQAIQRNWFLSLQDLKSKNKINNTAAPATRARANSLRSNGTKN